MTTYQMSLIADAIGGLSTILLANLVKPSKKKKDRN